MQNIKCPACGKRLDVPRAFSGTVTCPECQGHIPVVHGHESRHCPSCTEAILSDTTRCWKCGNLIDKNAPPPVEKGPDVSPGVRSACGMHVPGCITGITLSALGYLLESWAVYLIPIGLLVAVISAFSDVRYFCISCGSGLERGDLKVCPVCKRSLESPPPSPSAEVWR